MIEWNTEFRVRYACGFGYLWNEEKCPKDENGEHECETLCVKWDNDGNVLDIMIDALPSGKTRKPTIDDYKYIVESGQFDDCYIDYRRNYEAEGNRGHWIDNLIAYITEKAEGEEE